MKICMVSDTYYPYVGGISEHVFNLSRILRARGHAVKILTTNFKGKMLKTLELLPDEEFIYRIGNGLIIRANKSLAIIPIGWRLSDKVEKFFQKEDFDIIHIHGSLAPMLPFLAIRHSSSVNVITFHATHPKDGRYMLFYSLIEPFINKLHGRIAVSSAALMSNMHYLPGECRIIPNAINVDEFNPSIQPLPQFNNQRPKILFMGRFEPRKGLKYLIQALPIIKEQIPDILLIVCGAGLLGYAYQEYISKDVKENIYFAGLIKGEERARYYASCDVFCAPSVGHESFGIVLLEAMASGKPVVASDISGYRTILEDGKEGFLSQPREPKDIANRIIKILSNLNLSKTMAEAGRKKALRYTWTTISKQVEDYYQELLARYPTSTRRYTARQ